MLTDELRQRIEARYLELANPVEFDGIRTQIAAELGAPKPVVRAVVREVAQASWHAKLVGSCRASPARPPIWSASRPPIHHICHCRQ